MTSGHFTLLPIDNIIVIREKRQRRELKNIPDLAKSLQQRGLIHPIIIRRDNLELIAGERRLAAAKFAGWESISVQFTDELDENELRIVELEENTKREDLEWQERARAIKDYDEARRILEPQWTQAQTATALNMTGGGVSDQIKIARALETGGLKDIKEFSTARNSLNRSEERQKAVEEFRTAIIEPDERPAESILVEDFLTWAPTYSGPKFNFLHCDFPYGIGADKFNQGGADSHGAYADTEDLFWELTHCLGANLSSLTTESCHMIFWFGMRRGSDRLYEPIARALETQGWDINPYPLIWIKSDNSGVIPSINHDPRQIYETAFLCTKGKRPLVRSVANAFGAPVVRERHMSEKNEAMLAHFFKMVVDDNTIMLDPTCGSGAALRAAEGLKAKHVLGLEVNPEFADRARLALAQSRRTK